MTTDDKQATPARGFPKFVIGPLLAVAALAAIYGTMRAPSNAPVAAPSAAQTAAPSAASENAHPSITQAFVRKAGDLPNAAFQNASGQSVSLESFRGRVVLLNLWATWCIPCRKEMPALDRLQAALGGADFEVVALSLDRGGAAASKKFLDATGATKLALYVDPTAKLANEFKAVGLPTTLLIGRDGREIGRLLGPAEWDAEDAKTLVRAAMAGK
jgi:thiol-disulfide isomerase/thioredoxin